MADEGRKLTDKIQARMERDITREYTQAHKEVQAKLDAYLSRFEQDDKRYAMEVKAGRMSMKDYQDWRIRHISMGQRWEELRDTLAQDLHNHNQIAMSIAKGYMPEAYALNHNYGTFYMEKQGHIDTSYTLYNRETVEYLLRENPKLLPDPTPGSPAAIKLAENKDLKWNRQKLQSAMLQGCLQGEGIGKIADRFQNVTDMNRKAALRNARTAMTGAAGAGRHDSFVRGKSLGIELVEEWSAVLDHVTRDSHVDMDGERKPVDQATFSNGLRFPGDPYGIPAEVYNCFVGETIISTDSLVQRSYKHNYDGDLITIKTSSGVEFSCTPNHPILCPNGWVSAKLLNKGDNLCVATVGNDVFSRVNPNVDHTFPRIDAIHKLLCELGGKRTSRLGVNFHGDVSTSEVEIVTEERFLRNNGYSCKPEKEGKLRFKNSNKPLPCNCAFFEHFRGICKSALCLVRRFCKSLSFFGGSLGHSEIHCFRAVPLNYPSLVEPFNDCPSGSVELISENLYRLSGVVFADEIVNVDVKPFHGDVYNLQTENEYYFVNSIIPCDNGNNNQNYAIAHNCRCDLIAWVQGFEPSDEVRERKYDVGTFDDWMEGHNE